jgi:hypothetical protein
MNHKMFQYGLKPSRLMPARPFPCGFPDKKPTYWPNQTMKIFPVYWRSGSYAKKGPGIAHFLTV